MDPVTLLLPGAAAFAVAAVVLLARAVLARRGTADTAATTPPPGRWEAAAAALGYAAGDLIVNGRPIFPPVETWGWLLPLALAGGGAALAAPLLPGRAIRFWVPRALLAGAVAWLMARPLAGAPPGNGPLVLVGLAVALLAWTAALEPLASRAPAASLPIVLALVSVATAIAVLLSQTLRLAQLAGALGAGIAAVAVAALLWRSVGSAGGLFLVVEAVLPVIWLDAWAEAGLLTSVTALLAISPLAPWIAESGPLRRLSPWKAALIRVLAAAIPAGAAVGIAWSVAPPFE